MPGEQLTPGHTQQRGHVAVVAVPAQQLHSAQQLMLPPQTHHSTPAPSADITAAHPALAVSLHPTGNNSVALELTPTTASLLPSAAAPSLPSKQNACDSASMYGPTEGSAPHAAEASGIGPSLQQGSKLSRMDATLKESPPLLLDSQVPPLLDTQEPPLGHTQVHIWKANWIVSTTDLSVVMCESK